MRASFLSRAKTADGSPESGLLGESDSGGRTLKEPRRTTAPGRPVRLKRDDRAVSLAGGPVGRCPDRFDVGAVSFDTAALEDGGACHQHIGAG